MVSMVWLLFKKRSFKEFSEISRKFHIIKVLIDPKKRAIYDSVGVKGLENEDLQLVVRSKSPQEIREEYERLSKEREENLKEKLTHSQVIRRIRTFVF